MGRKHDKPKVVEISEKELASLKRRISDNQLRPSDRELMISVLNFVFWLQHKLSHAKISLHKLRKLFGFGRDSKVTLSRDNAHPNDSAEDEPPPDDNGGGGQPLGLSTDTTAAQDDNTSISSPPLSDANGAATRKKQRRNGRLSPAYHHKETIDVKHGEYAVSTGCPLGCGGRLYALDSGSVLRVKGQMEARVDHYQLERLRCNTCGVIYRATLPKNAGAEKYDARFKAQLAMKKYALGVPFYAEEHYQRALGFPLADATQWSLVEAVANSVYPVLGALEKEVMRGELVFYDDTRLVVLSNLQQLKANPQKARRGTFTTAVVGKTQGQAIYLYYSSECHAGENMQRLLGKRDATLPPLKTMADALNANRLDDNVFDVIACNCLSHGLRKF